MKKLLLLPLLAAVGLLFAGCGNNVTGDYIKTLNTLQNSAGAAIVSTAGSIVSQNHDQQVATMHKLATELRVLAHSITSIPKVPKNVVADNAAFATDLRNYAATVDKAASLGDTNFAAETTFASTTLKSTIKSLNSDLGR